MPDPCLIYVTAASEQEALRLARHAVENRLAACANMLPGMRSIYWWEGEVQTGEEVVLILKTPADKVEALTEALVELHSYACPCVVALPLVGGHPDFLNWIVDETRRGEER